MPTVLQSLNQGLHSLFEADPRVVILGEDILDPYGGAFKVTKGLSTRFPERVLATPISEAAIVGLATGLALRGQRPIAEIMFGDFLFLAGDQLVNHAAKFQWMYNDQVRVPMVVRTPMGGRRGYGPTHSQSIEKHFLGAPGLWVVAPHVLDDPGALLKQAVAYDAPVVFVESKTCYGRDVIDAVPGMQRVRLRDDGSPFATMWLRRDRADGQVWCYGGMTPHALEAVQRLEHEEGLLMDLVVVSQLSPAPVSHIEQIANATSAGVFCVVEEGGADFGWSAEIAARLQALQNADGRSTTILRIGAAAHPIPSSRQQELAALPSAAGIVSAVLNCF
jgi:pyruvate/2-oxoglutarate/acetoin dehydrogenase E1 component